MPANREDDKRMNEAYLNQDALGLVQQRDPNKNLKYPAKYDKNNSNYRQFAGLNNGAKISDAAMASSPDLSSDQENKVHGYIVMDSEQTRVTPDNPEVVIVGLYKTDLEYLRDTIKKDLQTYADVMDPKSEAMQENAVIGKLTDKYSAFIAKVKALDDVKKQMDKPQYKRKLTLAKRRL